MVFASLIFLLPWIGLLAFGASRKSSFWLMLCVALLCLLLPTLIGASHAENADSPGAVLVPFVVGVLGPALGAVSIVSWASEAPNIGYVGSAIGVVFGLLVGIAAYSVGLRRLAVLSAFFVFAFTAWLSSELLVGYNFAARARQQFPDGYCITSRNSVLTMIELGQSDIVLARHAELADGARKYHWSFHRKQWVLNPDPRYYGNVSLRQCQRT